MNYRIPLSYNPINVTALAKVLSNYKGKHHNQIITDFEQSISTLTKVPHVVAVNSGTAAIHLALLSMGIGKGDVVIAPTFTYVATINPIMYVGATPVLIDCEQETWNMDPNLLKEAIISLKKRGIIPKAIMIVHTYGMPAKMNEIMAIAKNERIPIIEDAAESLGSSYKGRGTGAMGAIGIFSFNNNKVITTYGGGVLITSDEEIAKRARLLATQAREDLPYYHHLEVGFNYIINPLSAAMGICELPSMGAKNEKRREVFTYYRKALMDGGSFQFEHPDHYSNRWLSTILFKDSDYKDQIINILAKNSIETRPLWKPMHLQPLHKNTQAFLNGNSQNYFNRGLCLPSFFTRLEDQAEVIQLIDKDLALGYKIISK